MVEIYANLVFPKPKNCIYIEGYTTIGVVGESKCYLLVDNSATDMEGEGINILIDKIGEKIGVSLEATTNEKDSCNDTVVIKIRTLMEDESKSLFSVQNSEGYYLEINKKEVNVCGVGQKGTFYAIQTLVQLLQLDGNRLLLPCVKIDDWPDMKYRGLFLEDRYGTDRMTLQDWKNTIDYMASLKLNFLSVGVYGCWCIQYDNEISEYWYLPVEKYPELKTPRTVRYYSVFKGGWEIVDYLPEMFKEDFFNELIAYGKRKNVIVRPHFNSLGHNTLIPRLYPETSAKDAEGRPTGYSFCMSNEKTYETLFYIYDEIIEKYLKPNDIKWFHMGLDEIVIMSGIDPNDPHKEVDPWCKCDRCSKLSHEELFIEHVVKLAKYLKSKGMKNISMWHDQLLSMNLFNENLIKRLKEEDLYDLLIINWWNYTPEGLNTTIPQHNIRKFITPITGYYHWMLTSSYLTNIYTMLKLAYNERVEGAEAYSTFDYSYDRNYHCFSEYTWNAAKVGELETFREHYIRKHFPEEYAKAKKAFEYFDRFVEPGEKLELMFMQLSYYLYTYVQKDKDYPRNFPGEAFIKLFDNMEKSKILLREVFEDSVNAYNLFDDLAGTMRFDQKLLEHYKVECLHYRVLSNEYLTLIELNERCSSPELLSGNDIKMTLTTIDEIIEEIRVLIVNREKLMLAVEQIKDKYLVPSELRNLSIHRQFLLDLEFYFKQLRESIRGGIYPTLPLLNLKDARDIESKMYRLLR